MVLTSPFRVKLDSRVFQALGWHHTSSIETCYVYYSGVHDYCSHPFGGKPTSTKGEKANGEKPFNFLPTVMNSPCLINNNTKLFLTIIIGTCVHICRWVLSCISPSVARWTTPSSWHFLCRTRRSAKSGITSSLAETFIICKKFFFVQCSAAHLFGWIYFNFVWC